MMTTNFHRETAKIYEFPIGGRASLDRRNEALRNAAEISAARAPRAAVGSSWYHEAAIQEDAPKPNS